MIVVFRYKGNKKTGYGKTTQLDMSRRLAIFATKNVWK